MIQENSTGVEELARRLNTLVLDPIKSDFVGKDDIVDLIGVCLVGGEHLFLYGPPGTAKSALVHGLGRRLQGRVFDYLLTRFTEPGELFGPFDIRRLREGDLVTNTEGMLPEASLVFLDELLNANSAILNSLLMALNERVFRRGRETRDLPLLMAIGASNHLPEDDALQALFDRFLVRIRCDNVAQEKLSAVLQAGWKLERRGADSDEGVTIDEVRQLQQQVNHVDVGAVRDRYVELVHQLRHAGIPVSDRRAVRFQRLIAASAVLCGRQQAHVSDLWVLRHTWDTEEQEELIRELVRQCLEQATDDGETRHLQSYRDESPQPEILARDLKGLLQQAQTSDLTEAEVQILKDRLTILSGRCAWVTEQHPRDQLQDLVDQLWSLLEPGRAE